MKRDHKDIKLAILQMLELGDCRKTEITYKINLNFHSSRDRLAELERLGYLKYDANSRYYRITPMGKHACQVLHAAELVWQ